MPQHPPPPPLAVEYEIVFAQLRTASVVDLLRQSAELSQQTEAIGRLVEAVRDTDAPKFVTYTAG